MIYGVTAESQYDSESSHTNLVDRLIKVAGLKNWEDAYPKELSGGMKKKTEIVRSFAVSPSIILADEPFGGIDAISKDDLQKVILDLWASENITMLYATHDIEDALFMGDRIAVLPNTPGPIKSIIDVPFERPREFSLRLSNEFQSLRGKVKALIEKN